MDAERFAAILPIVVGGLLNTIIKEMPVSEDEAFERLYGSELYTELENEETKVWTYSTSKLFYLFSEEIRTGKLELPEY